MFSPKFLSKMAQMYQLSKDQENVFLLRFGDNHEDREVATIIGISEEAYRKRMGEIYRKFDISGRGPGKNNRLIHILQNHLNHEDNILTTNNHYTDSTSSVYFSETDSQIENIEEIVTRLRLQTKQLIQERCTTMRVLDMSRPVNLEEIYTSTDVLEKINSRRRLNITDIRASYHKRDRVAMNPSLEDRVTSTEVLNRYQKLMLLGKPGAGKTTLLKYTALKCSQGEVFSNAVPIFITLRQYASAEFQPHLLEYIVQDLQIHSITDEHQIKKVFQHGRAILFLDGLDEVKEEDLNRVIEDIKTFSEHYYDNRFIITSRLGSQEYIFEKFTEVEIANFQLKQIAQFAQYWFIGKPQYAEAFLRKVEENRPIQELATNPLLLTLLCLVFDEYGNFPNNRAELYREGLDVLLKKWDAKRNIERHQIYKNLSMQRKEDLLAKVAFTTFCQGDYFFTKVDLEQYITEYIRNLPQVSNNEESLQLDSEAIIKSIESQHGLFVERAKGIYSFSHLTFQEYLTAREIIQDSRQEKLHILSSKITDYRWHDILKLAVSMMRSADDLLILMKEKSDQIISSEKQLQSLISWVNEKVESIPITEKPQSFRSFYLTLARAIVQSDSSNLANILARTLVLDLDLYQNQNLNHDLALDLTQAIEKQASIDLNLDIDLDLNLALEYAQEMNELALAEVIQNLINNCPDNIDSHTAWLNWTNYFRQQLITYRNIGHMWQLNSLQLELLQQYCNANHLIWECIESDCYIHQSTRQTLKNSLLLPIK
jgi:hypothetical protein